VLLLHFKSNDESSREEAEAPLGWALDTLLQLVWGDADLGTPPPGRAKKRWQPHPLRIRQQVPDVSPGHLIIHLNKKKRRV